MQNNIYHVKRRDSGKRHGFVWAMRILKGLAAISTFMLFMENDWILSLFSISREFAPLSELYMVWRHVSDSSENYVPELMFLFIMAWCLGFAVTLLLEKWSVISAFAEGTSWLYVISFSVGPTLLLAYFLFFHTVGADGDLFGTILVGSLLGLLALSYCSVLFGSLAADGIAVTALKIHHFFNK